jgi:hypothetical protein
MKELHTVVVVRREQSTAAVTTSPRISAAKREKFAAGPNAEASRPR